MCDCEIQAMYDARDIAHYFFNNINPIKSFEHAEIEDYHNDDKKTNRKFSEKFKLRQASVLDHGKEFEASLKLYETSANELRRAFEHGQTRGMMVLFKQKDGKFHDSKIYDSTWLEKNEYGSSTGWQIDMENKKGTLYVRDFEWEPKKVYNFAKCRDELVVTANVYPVISMSESKVMDNACEIAVGLDKESPKMREMMWKSMLHSLRHPKGYLSWIDIFLEEQQNIRKKDMPFPKKLFEEVFKEHEPSIEILCKKEELRKIPIRRVQA